MVLQGDKQKTGKSTFIRFLNPFQHHYYTEAKITGNEKDVSIRLTENFIYNIEELEGIHRKEMGFIKSMLSTQYCKDRRPHAVYEIGRTRRVNFWGSTNPREILQDTENTRWLIFPVKGIDWGYKQLIDINKVWAQAYHLYKSEQFNYDLTEKEAAYQAASNEEFGTVKPEEELIAQWFIPGKEDEHFMTATQICHELSRVYDRIRLSPFAVGRAMKKIFNMKPVAKRDTTGQVIRGYYLISKLPPRS
jgi:predicted P-loop ATPase